MPFEAPADPFLMTSTARRGTIELKGGKDGKDGWVYRGTVTYNALTSACGNGQGILKALQLLGELLLQGRAGLGS